MPPGWQRRFGAKPHDAARSTSAQPEDGVLSKPEDKLAQEQNRERNLWRQREVDAAVREGVRRRTEVVGDSVSDYLSDYANVTDRKYVGPKLLAAIRDAWREQHAHPELYGVPLRSRAVDHARPVP